MNFTPPPRLLVIGRNGQVGFELMRALAPLGHVFGVDYPEIDLASVDSIRGTIRDLSPTVIINAAAYTAVDKAEAEADRALLINATAPGILAEEASRRDALLVHYSTDYVFDGMKSCPYLETDEPRPLNVYGRSKLEGDNIIQMMGGGHLIFRLCWVYGGRGQNFLRTMYRLATTRDELRVVNDQRGSPTWCRWIAEVTAHAVIRVLQASEPESYYGTYNLSAGGETTWHHFAESIVERVPASIRRCQRVVPISTSEYPLPARRPAYSVLDGSRLRQTFGLALPDWELGLGQAFESGIRLDESKTD